MRDNDYQIAIKNFKLLISDISKEIFSFKWFNFGKAKKIKTYYRHYVMTLMNGKMEIKLALLEIVKSNLYTQADIPLQICINVH